MSADKSLRVIHYLNQFFGGIGGEDKANSEPELREGEVGPGQALQKALGERGKVVATAICGDNYFAENTAETSRKIIELVRPYHPDIVIAGPAFDAGRYGVACGAVCQAVQHEFKIPAITAMYPENPGVDLYHKEIYIVGTGNSVMSMNEAITRMVKLAIKLINKQEIGKPAEDGYIPRGIIVNELAEHPGAERVVTMLLRKLKGEPFESEVSQPKYDRIPPAPAITSISSANIALVTDGGLMPKGNPDRIESAGATRFGHYNIKGIEALNATDFDVYHSGYDPVHIRQDPNRLVPVDVFRVLEKERAIGSLHDNFYSTTGVATTMENARRIGQAIATELQSNNVSGVILTSTWGTSTRCGAALTKEIERTGIPTAHVCTMTPVASMVGSNRIVTAVKIVNPMGNADLDLESEKVLRRSIAERALRALQSDINTPTFFWTSA